MRLQDRLDEIERQLLTVIDPQELAALAAAIERLRMLQIVEQGLAAGDLLPDFALPDGSSPAPVCWIAARWSSASSAAAGAHTAA